MNNDLAKLKVTSEPMGTVELLLISGLINLTQTINSTPGERWAIPILLKNFIQILDGPDNTAQFKPSLVEDHKEIRLMFQRITDSGPVFFASIIIRDEDNSRHAENEELAESKINLQGHE